MAIDTKDTKAGGKPAGDENKDGKGGTPDTKDTKDGGEGEGEGSDDDDEGGDDKPDEKDKAPDAAYVKELKEEAKQRRLENKKLKADNSKTKAELERYKKGLAIIQGKEAPELDPVEETKKQGDTKLRNAMLKAELASRATDANDVALLFSGFKSRFDAVEVDVDAETVDGDAVDEILKDLRKEKPFLFRGADADEGATKKKGGSLSPDGPGRPTKAGAEYATWKQMQSQNRPLSEIQAYYNKNRVAILAGAPK